MRLGILGGSFNPIHHGHLIAAERAAEALRLDRLLLVPTAQTPLKDPTGLAPARDRLAMARLAVRKHPILETSDIEIRRRGPSFTINTLRALQRRGTELFVIIGADLIGQLPMWKEIRDVARLCTFGVVTRAASKSSRMPKYILHREIKIPRIDISGTEIRARVRSGLSIRFLVPDSVASFILRHGLYLKS